MMFLRTLDATNSDPTNSASSYFASGHRKPFVRAVAGDTDSEVTPEELDRQS